MCVRYEGHVCFDARQSCACPRFLLFTYKLKGIDAFFAITTPPITTVQATTTERKRKIDLEARPSEGGEMEG